MSETMHQLLSNNSEVKCVGSQIIEDLFSETKEIFHRNTELIDKISICEREKYNLIEQVKEAEQNNHNLVFENKSLKQELEYEKNESSKHLSHILRLQNKIEEVKRMENEEFIKIRRDELKYKKELDEIKLKLKRTQDELTKLKLKEDEINSLREYFAEKKQNEENEIVKKQLQFEKDKLSLLGLIRNKDKKPILKVVEYLEMHEVNQIAMLSKNYRNTMNNECLFVWKSAYRNINIAHKEKELELEKEIKIKSQEIKNIIPYKKFDLLDFCENQEDEVNLTMLIQMYS